MNTVSCSGDYILLSANVSPTYSIFVYSRKYLFFVYSNIYFRLQ